MCYNISKQCPRMHCLYTLCIQLDLWASVTQPCTLYAVSAMNGTCTSGASVSNPTNTSCKSACSLRYLSHCWAKQCLSSAQRFLFIWQCYCRYAPRGRGRGRNYYAPYWYSVTHWPAKMCSATVLPFMKLKVQSLFLAASPTFVIWTVQANFLAVWQLAWVLLQLNIQASQWSCVCVDKLMGPRIPTSYKLPLAKAW